jgi:hypothetical protein
MLTQATPAIVQALSGVLPADAVKQLTQALGNCEQPLTHRGGLNIANGDYPTGPSGIVEGPPNERWVVDNYRDLMPPAGNNVFVDIGGMNVNNNNGGAGNGGPGGGGGGGGGGDTYNSSTSYSPSTYYNSAWNNNNYEGSQFYFPTSQYFSQNQYFGGNTTNIAGNSYFENSYVNNLTSQNFVTQNIYVQNINGQPVYPPGGPPSGPPGGDPGGGTAVFLGPAGPPGAAGADGAAGQAGQDAVMQDLPVSALEFLTDYSVGLTSENLVNVVTGVTFNPETCGLQMVTTPMPRTWKVRGQGTYDGGFVYSPDGQ